MNGNGKYHVLRWVTCAHCGGKDTGCQQCFFGKIQVEVNLEDALRDLGIIDQLALMQGEIDRLQKQVEEMQKHGAYRVLVDDFGTQYKTSGL
jgi:hypothetical protein